MNMKIKDVRIGIKVKFSIDLENEYQVIEINPKVSPPITIRSFGNGVKFQVRASEIEIP